MTTFFPDLESQLESRAHTEGARSGVRQKRAKILALSVACASVTSGAAFASGLWQPSLGEGDNARVAVAGAPANEFIETIAALGRPQTEADRSKASEFALTFPADQRGVRTEFVRSLDRTNDGRSLVLIPITDRLDGVASATDEICLWIEDAGSDSSGNRQCSTVADLKDGQLFIANGGTDEELEKKRDEYTMAYFKNHPEGGSVTLPPELQRGSEQFTVTGLAPNGANFAEVGEGEPRVSVDENVFEATTAKVPKRVTFYAGADATRPIQ